MIDPQPLPDGAIPPDEVDDAHTTDPMSRTTEWGGPAPPSVIAPHVNYPAAFGRYHVRRELGRGGFGMVFEGWDPHLERPVAIKVPLPELLDSPEKSRAFLDEARRAVKLEHPGIVAVFDAGESGGFVYIVTQFIRGESLEQRLSRVPFLPDEASNLVARLADIVHFAHTRGWVHRDIKPGNVLIDDDGMVRLTDFGIATRLDDLRRSVSGASGSPPYMAPEIVRPLLTGSAPGPADHRTDIYALGVLLYELLTRRRPFSHDSRARLFEQIVNAEPVPPRLLNAAVPVGLEEICLRAMARDPANRFRTAGDLRDALQTPPARLPAAPPVMTLAPARRSLVPVFVVGLLVILIVLIALRLRPAGDASPAPPSPPPAADELAELRARRDELERQRETERAGMPVKPQKPSVDKDVPWPKSMVALRKEIEEAKRAGDEKRESSLLLKATNELIDAGQFEAALVGAERMVALAGKDPSRISFAYGQMGLAQARLGRAEAAIASYEEALKVYRGMYDRLAKFPDGPQKMEHMGFLARMIGLMLNRIGNANKYLERYKNAETAYREARELLQKHDRKSELVTVLMNFGSLESARGEHRAAVVLLEQALVLARELKNATDEGELLVNLGNAQSRAGDNAAALASFEQAAKLVGPSASYEARSRVLINWILSLLEAQRLDEARKLGVQLQRMARPDDEDAQRVLKLLGGARDGPNPPFV